MQPAAKPWWQSKTIWVNALQTLLAICAVVAGEDWIKSNPGWAASAAAVMGVLNVGLRLITSLPIGGE